MNIIVPHSDRLIQAHRHFTGAKNTYWLNELIRYLRGKGLLNNVVLYPMTGGTNYGTGSSARGIGLLTSNVMTLVNGPTWGASGIGFDGSTQYGNVGRVNPSSGLTVFTRLTHSTATPTASEVFLGAYNQQANDCGFIALLRGAETGDPYEIVRTSGGTVATREDYDTAGGHHDTSDNCIVWQWQNANSRSIWKNKTNLPLTLDFGSAQSSTFYALRDTYFMANNDASPAAHMNATAHALAFLTVNTDTTVRETITDMINEL